MKKIHFAALIAICVGMGGLIAGEALAKGPGGGGGGGGGGNRGGGGGGVRIGLGTGGSSIRIGGGSGHVHIGGSGNGGGSSHAHSQSSSGSHKKHCYCPPFYLYSCPPSVIVAGGPPRPVVVEDAVIPVGSVIEIPGYWGKYDGAVIVEFAGGQHPAKVVRWTEKGVMVEMPHVKLLVPSCGKLLIVRWDKYVFPPMDVKLVPAVVGPVGGPGGVAGGSGPAGGTNGPAGSAVAGAPVGGAGATSVAAGGAAVTGGSVNGSDKAQVGQASAKPDATVAAKPAENKGSPTEPPGTFDEAIPDEIK